MKNLKEVGCLSVIKRVLYKGLLNIQRHRIWSRVHGKQAPVKRVREHGGTPSGESVKVLAVMRHKIRWARH